MGSLLGVIAALATVGALVGLPRSARAGQVASPPVVAQAAAPAVVQVRLKDGSVIYGVIQSEDADRIVIKTVTGLVIDIERAQIASLRAARGRLVAHEFWPADANATRLMFGPTGRSLARGEGYIGVYEFLLPFVQVGITDRLSIGVGTPLVFTGDETGRPIWVTPKLQVFKNARTSAAVGAMHFFIVGENVRLGFAYMATTTGTDDHALTMGLGWAYARYHETQYDDSHCVPSPAGAAACAVARRTTRTEGAPIFMIGGERRLTRRVKFVTEDYAFESGGIVSVGVRFLGDRLSADLGVFSPVTSEGLYAAPAVNFVWTFGRGALR